MFRSNFVAALFSGVLLAGAATTAYGQTGLSGAYLAAQHAEAIGDVDQAGRYYARALALDPDNPALMEQTMIHQVSAGRVDQAVPAARALNEIMPEHRLAALVLTVDEFRRGAFETSRARLRDTPDTYHALVGALFSGWAAYAVGDEAGLRLAFTDLEDRSLVRVFAGYHLGLIRAAQGDLEVAAETMDRAMEELNTPTGRMARGYAGVLRRAGRLEDAAKVYENAIAVTVGDAVLEREISRMNAGEAPLMYVSTAAEGAAEALYGLASALGEDGGRRLSLFYTQLALHLRPEFSEASLLAAERFEQRDQHRLAVRAYESIGAEDPLHRAAEIGRAKALHALGEESEAVEALKSLARRMPAAIDVHVALGDMMRRLRRFEEGADAYDAAIQLMAARGRDSWVLFYQRGICRERSDEWDLAEADFRRALELREDQPLVLNYLGYSWLEKKRNYREALEMISRAAELRPKDGYIVDSLGWAHFLLENYEQAVTELERAVSLSPVDPVINDHLGDALWKVGRRLEAEFQWRRALSFEPEKADAQRIVEKLDKGLDAVEAEEAVSKEGETPEEAAAATNGG